MKIHLLLLLKCIKKKGTVHKVETLSKKFRDPLLGLDPAVEKCWQK